MTARALLILAMLFGLTAPASAVPDCEGVVVNHAKRALEKLTSFQERFDRVVDVEVPKGPAAGGNGAWHWRVIFLANKDNREVSVFVHTEALTTATKCDALKIADGITVDYGF